jgi:hypothetical protein
MHPTTSRYYRFLCLQMTRETLQLYFLVGTIDFYANNWHVKCFNYIFPSSESLLMCSSLSAHLRVARFFLVKHTKLPQKYTKIFQTIIKHAKIFDFNALRNGTKFWFWVWNYTIWQPSSCLRHLQQWKAIQSTSEVWIGGNIVAVQVLN